MTESLLQYHDYKELDSNAEGSYSILYSVIRGERKLLLKAVRRDAGSVAENYARLQREYNILKDFMGMRT